ncbi:MAG: flippase-like domain-containing protein [Gemmatimonadetes bacterium]|nr:flippase-like domain-containing protein [Gemmatimonadota bacterium]
MKKVAVGLLQLGLTVAVTWFIFDRVGVDLAVLGTLNAGEFRPRPALLLASCAVLASGYLWSASLWGRLVRDLGGPRLPVWTSVRVFMVANLGRYVPGKVWQIAGLAYLAKREGVPPSVATGAAILGQGIALLGATLVGMGALFGANELWREIGWAGRVAGIGFVLAIIGAVVIPSVFRQIVAFWFRITRSDPPADGLKRGNFGLRWLILYVVNWGIYATAFWLLYLSFGEWRTFWEVGPAFAAAYVAGYIAVFAPAGAGIREGILVVLLQPIMAREAAVVLAVIARLWTTVLELVPAGLLVLVWRRSRQTEESIPTGKGIP